MSRENNRTERERGREAIVLSFRKTSLSPELFVISLACEIRIWHTLLLHYAFVWTHSGIRILLIFFLYFIYFWVFTVFTSTQDTSQISTCINLHYTTLLHKENTTTLDYENKRKEKKEKKTKKRGIAYWYK